MAALVLLGLTACDPATDPVSGSSVSISFAPCTIGFERPDWVAYQDGSEAWTRVTATSATSPFEFTLTSGKGAVALHTSFPKLLIVYASSAELKEYLASCAAPLRTITGTVTGFTAADRLSLFIGQRYAFPGSAGSTASFSIADVAPAASELIAIRARLTSTSQTTTFFPDNVLIRTGVTGSTTAALDFNSVTEAGAPVQRTATVTNLSSSDLFQVLATIVTPDNGWTPEGSILGHAETEAGVSSYITQLGTVTGSVTAPFYGVASTRLTSGEQQVLTVIAGKNVSSTIGEYRFATVSSSDAVDRSITFGSPIGPVTVTGTSRPSARYPIQTGYDQIWNFIVNNPSVEVILTREYAGTATEVTLAVPDLSGVSGFLSQWLPIVGSTTTWEFSASSASLPVFNGKALTFQGALRTDRNFRP